MSTSIKYGYANKICILPAVPSVKLTSTSVSSISGVTVSLTWTLQISWEGAKANIVCMYSFTCTDVPFIIQTKRGKKKTKATPPLWSSMLWLLQLWLWCSHYILQIASVSLLMTRINNWHSDSDCDNSSLELRKKKIHKYFISDELCKVMHLLFSVTRESYVNYSADMLSSIIRSQISSMQTLSLPVLRIFSHAVIFSATVSMSCWSYCLFHGFPLTQSLFLLS